MANVDISIIALAAAIVKIGYASAGILIIDDSTVSDALAIVQCDEK